MRSRLAILLMLTLGFGLSGAGMGLAVTGVSNDGVSPAEQQYGNGDTGGETVAPPTPTQPTDDDDVLGETDEQPTVGGGAGDAPAEDEVTEGQEVQQVAVQSNAETLPFTGFAAIPVLLMGLALLTGGFLMRRRGSDS